MTDLGDLGQKQINQTCYYVADDEQFYNKFVSRQINENETTDKIQFKIIHLNRKTNRAENLDATTELHNLMKNDTTTTGAEKKRAGTIFGAGSKSIEKHVREHGKRSSAKPRFLLGR